MTIEKLSDSVSIDKENKVIYFSALDDESKFLIEMNKGDGYVIKSASEMPKKKRTKKHSESNEESMNRKTKEYWLSQLDEKEQEHFNMLCEGKCNAKNGTGKSTYRTAVAYANEMIAKKQKS